MTFSNIPDIIVRCHACKKRIGNMVFVDATIPADIVSYKRILLYCEKCYLEREQKIKERIEDHDIILAQQSWDRRIGTIDGC